MNNSGKSQRLKNSRRLAASLVFGLLFASGPAAAAAGFSYRADLLGIGEYYDAADTPINTGPQAQRSRYRLIAAQRLDLKFQTQQWLLIGKPRTGFSYTHFTGSEHEEHTEATAVVHEALVRFSPMARVFLSVGRESLQWGPSYLVSVSNPFNQDNGRNNPITEVPGMDYARAVWLPSQRWSIASIANVGRGELKYSGEFARQYALKIDYNGGSRYWSLIPSWRESATPNNSDEDYRLGSYAGWTVSDALLIYAEAAYRHLQDHYAALAGTAYTFTGGTNLALEYYRNSSGCALKPYVQCFVLGALASAQTSQLGLTRTNYLLVQLLDPKRFEHWDFTLRWITGLDDQSNQVVGIADFNVTPSAKIYLIGSASLGSQQTEYRSVLNAFTSIGLRYSF